MCIAPIVGAGGIAVTPNGLKYYLDTAEGHSAQSADMAREMGPGLAENSQNPPPGTPGSVPEPTPQELQDPESCAGEKISLDEFVTLPNGTKSKYFKIGDMRMAPTKQLGLCPEDIVANWSGLVGNILEPARARFPFKINSAFRTLAFNSSLGNSSKTSDHLTGCAADISMGSVEANKELFKYIGKTLNSTFSQIIFEGRWVHVAYKGRSPASVAVLVTRTGAPPYQNGGGRPGLALPSDLRWA